MRHPGADDGIDQRRPDEIAWDIERLRADHERRTCRQVPQDHHEGDKRDDGAEQRDADLERRVDELLDVIGDPLVGVVGKVAFQPHTVVGAVAEPAAEIAVGEPAAPPDLQPLLQIELIHGADDEEGREHAEHAELPDEGVPILVLQRVVEGLVPSVEADVQPDLEELKADHGHEQHASGPAVLGTEIGDRNAREFPG